MKASIIILITLLGGTAPARDIRVGIDKDAPTIHHGIKLAQPGDIIHLEPKIYRDYAGFYGKKGAPGKPVTLDGHGATLEGSDPIDPTKWTEIAPGLFKNDALLPRLDDAITGRWFFLVDGKMQLMNRTSKGKSAPYKKPEELGVNEWTFIKGPPRADAKPLQTFGTFYLKIAPGVKLADANICYPVRSAGVQFSGDNAHLVIKNLTATHPYNDGFNIHGDCRDCVFENIRAIECGDDGISAHESAQYRVDGFVSIGNSTGICDTGTAQTSYANVFMARNIAFDLYFLDEGRYAIKNALVLSSAQNPLMVTGRATGDCRMRMENVLIRRLVEPRVATVAQRAVLEARNCTFENLDVKISGAVTWTSCLINGRSMSDANAKGADVTELMKLAAADVVSKPLLMLPGTDGDPGRIDHTSLPVLQGTAAIVCPFDEQWKLQLHNYLLHHDGKFWCMWSHGPVVEDVPTQHVSYATSEDGLKWSAPKSITGPPAAGRAYIARSFWVRDGELLALVASYKGKGAFGVDKDLRLVAYAWDKTAAVWKSKGRVFEDAINNFTPQRLSSSDWMMTRRDAGFNVSMLVGGVKSLDDWRVFPVVERKSIAGFSPDEPVWWQQPDHTIIGLIRDNGGSSRLYRTVSTDLGQTWSTPMKTNYPNSTSKVFSLLTSRGYRVLISNANPAVGRRELHLAVSEDGVTFVRMARLGIPSDKPSTLQYPHAIEHDGHLFIAFSRNKNITEVLKVPLDEAERLRR